MSDWQTIDSAPKDVPILAWCKTTCDDPLCAFSEHASELSMGMLCLYHAHAEGLQSCDEGLQILEWGGGFQDGPDDGGAGAPDWWFRRGGEFEESANPTHWMPLPEAPK